jgi:hypothetical protein
MERERWKIPLFCCVRFLCGHINYCGFANDSPISRFANMSMRGKGIKLFFRVLFTKIKYISCRVCRRTEHTAFQQTIKTILLRSLFSAPSSALPASLHYVHSISRAKNAAPVFFSMLNSTSYCYYLEL